MTAANGHTNDTEAAEIHTIPDQSLPKINTSQLKESTAGDGAGRFQNRVSSFTTGDNSFTSQSMKGIAPLHGKLQQLFLHTHTHTHTASTESAAPRPLSSLSLFLCAAPPPPPFHPHFLYCSYSAAATGYKNIMCSSFRETLHTSCMLNTSADPSDLKSAHWPTVRDKGRVCR